MHALFDVQRYTQVLQYCTWLYLLLTSGINAKSLEDKWLTLKEFDKWSCIIIC